MAIERYAFIDASNTSNTTIRILGFRVSWRRLIEHLKGERWGCKEVFYYEGRLDTAQEEKRHDRLERMGYTMRSKITFIHKPDKHEVAVKCSGCDVEIKTIIQSQGKRKSNCDVELTVDALSLASPDKEFLILTGDGDFRYLIEKLIQKGVRVAIVSSNTSTTDQSCRYSTRLKELVSIEEQLATTSGNKTRVRFLEINNWKQSISQMMESGNEETAAKRDGFE